MYWRRGRNGALRHFLQHVVAADGFDDFLFGVLAIVLIVVVVVAFGSAGEFVGRSNGVAFTGVLDMRRVVGMGRVFACLFLVMMLIMRVCVMSVFSRRRGGRLDRRHGGDAGFQFRDRGFACGICPFVTTLRIVIVVMIVIVVIMRMIVIVIMRLVIMCIMVVMGRIPGIILMMLGVVRMHLAGIRAFVRMRLAFIGLGGLRGILAGVLDDAALDAVAMAAAARIAVARAATVAVGGAVLALFLGLAVGALVGLDQRLTVGDRDLIVVRVDFAERQEAVAVAAIFDERRLQRRFYARDLGEIDIAAELLALGGLEIKFFDAIAADHNDPGLFRVGGVDQHLVGHFGTLDGGGRGAWRAQIARPGDATVHLIRG